MTIYTPHLPRTPSETCEIVAVLADGRVKVELVRFYASRTVRTGTFRTLPALQLAADGGLKEINAAIDKARATPVLTPEEKLARDIRLTGRLPYDPSREESR